MLLWSASVTVSVMLPVIVTVPVAVEPAPFVNEKEPLPDVGVRFVSVKLVSAPESSSDSASKPVSLGKPTPTVFAGALEPAGFSSDMRKQPLVAGAE